MIDVYEPKLSSLKKYIDHFTKLDFGRLEGMNYFVFPQYGTTIDLSRNTGFKLKKGCCSFEACKGESFQVFLTGKYIVPFQMEFKNHIDEIGINFKPNGVNAFFDKPFAELTPSLGQIIVNEKWKMMCEVVFQTNDFRKRCELLERELEKLILRIPLTQVDHAITIFHEHPKIAVKEVARKVGWSERSLNRNFNKYIGCSPRVYKRILRFRKVIQLKYQTNEEVSLTVLSLDNGYFDSPHFTKEFKKLTGQSPKNFFQK